MSKKLTRAIVTTLSLTLAVGPFQFAHAEEQTISCNSDNGRYNFCRADTDGHVELIRQHHRSSNCDEGRDWGSNNGGVWVNHGCRAEFRVGENHDDHKNNHPRTKAIAIGAAAIGALALGAMLLKNNQNGAAAQNEVSWGIGSFTGYDATERSNVDLDIAENGSLTGHAGNNNFSGSFDGQYLQAGRHQFSVMQSGDGFTATDVQNPNHRVSFHRAY